LKQQIEITIRIKIAHRAGVGRLFDIHLITVRRNGFGLMFHPPKNRIWLICFGLWAFIGIGGAASGSIPAPALTRSARIPPTRALNIAPIFPLMFYRLDQ
jgi:hypothetical protein